MKRTLFFLLLHAVCGLGVAAADQNVKAVQTRLKAEGFYFGDATGAYDSATSAGVTRYQIRHGLAISGRLDPATAQALGVAPAPATAPEPSPTSGTWRQLRNGDMQFLQKLNEGEIPPPATPPPSAPTTPARTKVATKKETQPKPAPAAPAREEPVPQPRPQGEETRPATASASDASRERLRDYVGAFVLAGLDQKVGAELEFFGPRVNYFGERNLGRARIRRDLVRYDARWPKRRFWLAGELEIEEEARGELKVTFPLRYELRHGSKHASGKVRKTLTLRKTGDDDFEIVAVNER